MIVYKTNDWLHAIIHFHQSKTIVSLLKRVGVVALYIVPLCIIEIRYVDLRLKYAPSELFAALGILLSLMLIFRSNTAYDRFYEGRRAWGTLVNTIRNLAVLLEAVLPANDQANRLYFAKMLSNFPFVLKNHLRDDRNLTKFEDPEEGAILERLACIEHLPDAVVTELRKRVEQLYRAGVISDSQSINLNDLLVILLDVAGICERIKSTPIPFSYSFFIKLFITIYIIVLPFSMIDEFGFMTIPTILITSYILIGLEMIGVEIEEPFGKDQNDLPLSQLSRMMRINVHEIFGLPLPHVDRKAAKPTFLIVT